MGEKSIIRMGWIALAVTAVIATAELICTEKGVFAADTALAEEIITETEKVPEKGQIREDTASGMPCENREQFERWYETYEQETSEETPETTGGSMVDGDAEDQADAADPESARSDPGPEEMASETSGPTFYTINGELLSPELQQYLYARLADHGIEWFMPYAVMVAYQESHFDCTAVNQSNQMDMGLFQYRVQYYEGQDIFNPYEQIDIFCRQMANRASMGLDVYEMISRHHQSDWGAYNHEYVSSVLSHERGLATIGD